MCVCAVLLNSTFFHFECRFACFPFPLLLCANVQVCMRSYAVLLPSLFVLRLLFLPLVACLRTTPTKKNKNNTKKNKNNHADDKW